MGLFQLDETWDTLRKMLRPVVFIGSKSPPPPGGMWQYLEIFLVVTASCHNLMEAGCY